MVEVLIVGMGGVGSKVMDEDNRIRNCNMEGSEHK